MDLAEVGLWPGLQGLAYLVPYKNSCQAQIGYRGLSYLAQRSGDFRIYNEKVYVGDVFQLRLGLDAQVIHEPAFASEREDDNITHVYAIAIPKDGGRAWVEVLTREEVEKIRNSSPSRNSGPWKTWWGEMAMAKVIKRLCKRLPASPELEEGLDKDTELELRSVPMDLPAEASSPHTEAPNEEEEPPGKSRADEAAEQFAGAAGDG